MRGFSARLAARVVLIVLVVIVPALAIIVYDETNERRHAREDALDNVSRLAHLAATEEAGSLSGVQRLLATLSSLPVLRDDDPAACQTFLRSIVHDRPAYINMIVARARGGLVCAAANATARAAGPPAWFTRILETRAPVIGDYQRSLTNGEPAVIVAHPILDDMGHVDRVVAAVIRLEELNAVFKTITLPRGATLTLTDRRGTILSRAPDGAAWIGRTHTQFPSDGRPAGKDTAHPVHES